MGGGASIDGDYMNNFYQPNKTYESVKASGIHFNVAYETIKEKYQHTKSASSSIIESNRSNMVVDQDLTTIHFLAIRQLSYNLRNQDMLQKSRKFMMSKSLNNMVDGVDHAFVADENSDDRITNDAYESIRHTKSHNAMILNGLNEKKQSTDTGTDSFRSTEGITSLNRISETTVYVADELCHEDLLLVHDDDYLYPAAKKTQATSNTTSNTDAILSSSIPTDMSNSGSFTKKITKKPKPNLSLQITSEHSLSSCDIIIINPQPNTQPNHGHSYGNIISPNSSMHLSPRGTLHLGKLKVMETGIHQSARTLNTSGSSSSKLSGTGSSSRKAPLKLSAISGKREFIEINALGAGASGVVVEAIHIPSLTIVALKMLPVYNKEKRKHVSRELEVLYKNLTELRLVDDSLYSDHHDDNSSNNHRSLPSCRNIVSLYNAFIDPTSGLINLVIEYMDGGSLEDLVKQGGCTDERILADIAYQTCKGLSFLHDNKHVHRDIKPANILCSTSGHIKIADFGVAKALDNTSNFAHSFIGTVCYMSPERIVGESPYSFPCDIWSLGLTLLAVAKGRFPLMEKDTSGGGKEDLPKYKQAAGGAVGYWAMIKAICDDDPPTAGPTFTYDFNQFIAACLRKQPADRLTAKELLLTPLIQMNKPVLKLTKSDLHLRYASMYKNGSFRRSMKIDSDIDEESVSRFDNLSPLTKRLTDAAINRTSSSRIEPNFPVDQHLHGLEDEVTIAASVNAIRLTHLDRVLDRIVKRVTINSESSAIGFDSVDDFENENDDIEDQDFLDVHTYHDAQDGFMVDLGVGHPHNSNHISYVSSSQSSSSSSSMVHHADAKAVTASAPTDSKSSKGLIEEEKKCRCLPCVPEAEEKDEVFPLQGPYFHQHRSLRDIETSFSAMDTDDKVDDSGQTEASLVHATLIPHKSVHFLGSELLMTNAVLSTRGEKDVPVEDSKSDFAELSSSSSSSSQLRKSSMNSNYSNNSFTSDLLNPMYYRQVLPKLDRSGEQKWENLAQQLHLPLSLVKLAVRDKLGRIFNINEESS